ncbi:zinc finger protein 189 isoform X3 [Pieris rapae]|uniref:zinc finger protein 189 isoform X3 n=1 Tax=Pieris rapae TaxID=64459 RepID=UPI001E2818CF|nr:zinc finger protein 189 isoform X3 [Pieris rapae]
MVSKDASTWIIAKDLCRCCHAEGDFFNLATPNTYNNREEIYSDMLRTCFDIEIDPVPGGLCIPTYSICSKCVVKLRESISFKEQVLKCEEKFYELLTSSSIAVSTQIKKEPEMDIEDYNDDMDDDLDDEMDNYIDDDIDNDMDTIDTDLKIEPREHNEIEEHPKRPLRSRIQKTTDVTETKAAQEAKPKPKPKPKKPPKEKKVTKEEKKVKKEKKKEDDTERKDERDIKFIKRVENGSTEWQCADCGRNFKKRALLTQHYKYVHLKQRPKLRSCHMCSEKVPTQYRPFHMEKAHGLPLPSCGACGKKFAFPNQVLRHQKEYHMGEKQLTCAICEMKFVSNTLLLKHSIIHTGLRPYKCSYCDKSFRWKKNLKTHIYMHLDVRKHVCNICNESFVQQSSLKYHITKRHTDML